MIAIFLNFISSSKFEVTVVGRRYDFKGDCCLRLGETID